MKRLIYFTLILCALISCSHQPEEFNVSDIKEPINNLTFDIDLNICSDTIIVEPNDEYYIAYSSNDCEVFEARLFIDNRQIEEGWGNSDTLRFYASDSYGEGKTRFALKLEFDIKTNSGSVADKLNKEYHQVTKEYKLFLEYNYAPKIISHEVKDGFQHLTWERFKGLGFKSYAISNGFGDLAVITDPNTTHLIDSSYVGFERNYKFTINEINGKIESNYHIYKQEQEVSVLPHIKGNVITWDKSRYYNAIDKYLIYESLYNDNSKCKLIAEVGPDETSFTYTDGKFAAQSKYYLHPVSKINSPPLSRVEETLFYGYYVFATSEYYYKGKKWWGANQLINTLGGNVYAGEYHTLRKLNEENEFEDVFESKGGFCSGNANYYLVKNNDQLQLYTSSNKALVSEISLSGLGIKYDDWGLRAWRISDNGIALICTDDLYVYDMVNKRMVTTINIDDIFFYENPLHISSNGQYILHREYSEAENIKIIKLIKVEADGQISRIWEHKGMCYYEFDYVNNDKFYTYESGSLKSFTLEGNQISSKYIGDLHLMDIDYCQNEFVTINHDKSQFRIYDLTTGNLKHTVATFKLDYNSFWKVAFLANKVLYWNGGAYIKMEY